MVERVPAEKTAQPTDSSPPRVEGVGRRGARLLRPIRGLSLSLPENLRTSYPTESLLHRLERKVWVGGRTRGGWGGWGRRRSSTVRDRSTLGLVPTPNHSSLSPTRVHNRPTDQGSTRLCYPTVDMVGSQEVGLRPSPRPLEERQERVEDEISDERGEDS